MRGAFLDRDGILNKTYFQGNIPIPPSNLDEVEIIPGAIEAVKLFVENNFLPVVVTNQPDVARGNVDIKKVEAINNFLKATLPLTDIFTCYHDDKDKCNCR